MNKSHSRLLRPRATSAPISEKERQEERQEELSKEGRAIAARQEEEFVQRVEQALGDKFEYKTLYLAELDPDPRNARTRNISRANPIDIRVAETNPDYQETLSVIASINDMAEVLKSTPIIQPIHVYRDGARYIVFIGHVRYFGSLVAFGPTGVIDCKVFSARPESHHILRFVENSSRSNLSLKAKILDFQSAISTIDPDQNLGVRKIASQLGISKTVVALYRLATGNEHIHKMIDDGLIRQWGSVSSLYKLADIDNKEAMARVRQFFSKNSPDDKGLNDFLKTLREGVPKSRGITKAGGRRRSKAKIEMRDTSIARQLVSGELYKKFSWRDEDFESLDAFQKKIDECFASMEKNNDKP